MNRKACPTIPWNDPYHDEYDNDDQRVPEPENDPELTIEWIPVFTDADELAYRTQQNES